MIFLIYDSQTNKYWNGNYWDVIDNALRFKKPEDSAEYITNNLDLIFDK